MIRPHRRDEAWSVSLWQTIFALAVGEQIPAIASLPPSTCGCKKFSLDALVYHVSTCAAHSGAKTRLVKQVIERQCLCVCKDNPGDHNRGQRCGELAVYLADAAGPINLVMDLRIAHEVGEWQGKARQPLVLPSSRDRRFAVDVKANC